MSDVNYDGGPSVVVSESGGPAAVATPGAVENVPKEARSSACVGMQVSCMLDTRTFAVVTYNEGGSALEAALRSLSDRENVVHDITTLSTGIRRSNGNPSIIEYGVFSAYKPGEKKKQWFVSQDIWVGSNNVVRNADLANLGVDQMTKAINRIQVEKFTIFRVLSFSSVDHLSGSAELRNYKKIIAYKEIQ